MCMTDIGFHWILTHECTCPTIPTTLSQCPDLRMPDIHHFHPSTQSLPHYCDPKSNKQTKNSLQLSHSKFCIMLSISCISITFGGQGKLACFSTSKMFTMLPAATARSCPLRGWNLTLPVPPCFTCTTKSMSISYNNWTTARMNSCADTSSTNPQNMSRCSLTNCPEENFSVVLARAKNLCQSWVKIYWCYMRPMPMKSL